MEDLRNHLFAALEGLADQDKPMELDRARAISEVAKTLIDTARVEVDMLKVTGAIKGTGFIPVDAAVPALPNHTRN